MRTKYNRAIVYDLETGGLNCAYNEITEIAMVAVDLDNLTIIEEFSVAIKPRINLDWISTPIKDAKTLYKNLGEKDDVSGMKVLKFKGEQITLKNIDPLVDELTLFYGALGETRTLTESDIIKLENTKWRDIVQVLFNSAYNPQALEVTGISRELISKEGFDYGVAFKQIKDMIERHTIGNSKPIFVGHNIGSLPRRIVKGKEVAPDGFDNPFMEKMFKENGDDFFYSINDDIIDTLKWARKKWVELPSYSLGVCANEVGLTLKEAHRALPDTIANAKFFIKMMQHLRGEGSLKSRYKRRKFNVQL